MPTIEELAVKVETNAEQLKAVQDRQDHMDKLVASVAVLATEQKQLKTDVTEIKSDVKALTALPAKRWNDTVEKVTWAICAAVITFALSHIGL